MKDTRTPDNATKNHIVIIAFQPSGSISREKTFVAIDANRYPVKSKTPLMPDTIPLFLCEGI